MFILGACEMAQLVRVLGAKPDYPSSIPGRDLNGRRRELTSTSYPLTSIHTVIPMQWDANVPFYYSPPSHTEDLGTCIAYIQTLWHSERAPAH